MLAVVLSTISILIIIVVIYMMIVGADNEFDNDDEDFYI